MEIAYYYRKKRHNLGKIEIDLSSENKHTQKNNTFPSPSFAWSVLHGFSLVFSLVKGCRGMGNGCCSQSLTASLCCSFLLTHSPCSTRYCSMGFSPSEHLQDCSYVLQDYPRAASSFKEHPVAPVGSFMGCRDLQGPSWTSMGYRDSTASPRSSPMAAVESLLQQLESFFSLLHLPGVCRVVCHFFLSSFAGLAFLPFLNCIITEASLADHGVSTWPLFTEDTITLPHKPNINRKSGKWLYQQLDEIFTIAQNPVIHFA